MITMKEGRSLSDKYHCVTNEQRIMNQFVKKRKLINNALVLLKRTKKYRNKKHKYVYKIKFDRINRAKKFVLKSHASTSG